MGTMQIGLGFREQHKGATLDEFDNLVARVNTALRGIGTWNNQAFAATDYAGGGSQNWTVANGNVTTYEWATFGKTLIIHLFVTGTTVSGTANPALTVNLPGGLVVQNGASGAYSYKDNGTWGTGPWEVSASGTTVTFYKSNKANWAASTGATDVRASITCQVQ